MSNLLREVDEIPVTLVTAIAYATLAVVCDMFGPADEFRERLDTFGLLTPHAVSSGEPWRLLGHAFLHLHVLHLLMNLGSLLSLGPALERSLGSARFAALYLVSALGGGFACCVVYAPNQGVAGGSGALFGMMGAAVAINMRAGRHAFAFLDFEGPRRMLGWIVAYLVAGFWLPVSNTAHIGGLLAGFAATFLWLRPAPHPALRRWRLATAALFASFAFWSLLPVTRADWLVQKAQQAGDPTRQTALRRAAARAHAGTAVDVERLLAPRDRGR